ncbi:MAG: T9SS type A sorting domain-containing protein [Saprospiraceae bacterium]
MRAQKYDYHLISRNSFLGQGIHMQYVDTLADLKFEAITMDGWISASPVLSDINGNLLGYYNGVRLYDSLDRVAINGDSLNIGSFFSKYLFLSETDFSRGSLVDQQCLILPYKNDSTYIIFHMGFEYDVNTSDFLLPDILDEGHKVNIYSDGLYYSVFRATKEGRLKIDKTLKNIKIIDDFLRTGELFSCKHANGNDWWIMVPAILSNKCYSILLTGEEITIKSVFDFSNFNNTIGSGGGSVNFNTKGDKLVRLHRRAYFNLPDILEVWNFDRCKGIVGSYYFSDTLSLPSQYTVTADVEFSKNDQYLYVANGQYIFQMDMLYPDFFTARDTIARWDGFLYFDINPTLFDNMMRLPNGKIVVNSFNSTPYLHYIHEPDQKGLACHFEQRALIMPKDSLNVPLEIDFEAFPTFPPYRMEALDIDCSLAVDHVPDITLDVYPNPFRSQLFVSGFETLKGIISIEVFDLLGRLIHVESQDSYQGFKLLNTALWDPGIYIVSVKSADGEQRVTRKVVKM